MDCSGINELTLIINEDNFACEAKSIDSGGIKNGDHTSKISTSDIYKCVNTTASKHNISPTTVIITLLTLIGDEHDSKTNDCSILLKYGLTQVAASRALFHVFDKYKTTRSTKLEYTKNKD